MDNKSNMRKNKNSGSIMLLTILIGFCILAIIEIIYGQAQIRMEKERLALEEENHQAVQELKAEWNQLKGTPSVGSESVEEVGGEQSSTGETEKTLTSQKEPGDAKAPSEQPKEDEEKQPEEDDKEYAMQIVFMGDSIIDNERENGGVAQIISEACNARVYNMSIGGTTAALLPDEQYNFAQWESRGLLGVINAIRGDINKDIFDGYRAGEILGECDFSKTDYFVIEYGINDFLSRKIPQSRYLENGETLGIDDVHTYSGALNSAVTMLQQQFPDAKILLIAPHYCQFFEGGTFMGDGYSMNYGYGTLVEFSRCTGYVYEQNAKKNVLFFNAFENSGINAETADEYLEDGVHLSAAGRRVYAEYAAKLILNDFYPEE